MCFTPRPGPPEQMEIVAPNAKVRSLRVETNGAGTLANIVIIQHVDFYGCQMVELLEKYARLWGCLLLDV